MTRLSRLSIAVVLLSLALVAPALAQPGLAVPTTVATPGVAVNVTITGTPGQNYALLGSTTGGGFAYAGVALRVGPDVAILSVGVIPPGGQVVVPVTPPFATTTLDRYYLQAATSASPVFTPLQASIGVVLRNADLVTNLTDPCTGFGPAKMYASINAENFTNADNNVWHPLSGTYGFASGCGGFGARVKRISALEYVVDSGNVASGPFFDSGYVFHVSGSSRLATATVVNAGAAYSGPTDGVLVYVYLGAAAGFDLVVF